jgi:hypothetical protein
MKMEGFRQSTLILAIMLLGSAAQAEMGSLDARNRQYYPRKCALNGTDAVCTFAVVNRGPAATVNAWAGRDLYPIEFIDNAKVPHNASNAYFLDKFGARQPSLVLQNGEQGWYVIEFAHVDSRVTSGSFKFNNRVVGQVAVTPYVPPAAAAPVAAPPVAAPPSQTPAPTASASSSNCPPNDKACKAADKMGKVQSATDNTAKTVDNAAKTVDAVKGMFGFGKRESPPQPAQPQQAPPQQTQPGSQ